MRIGQRLQSTAIAEGMDEEAIVRQLKLLEKQITGEVAGEVAGETCKTEHT
jgi:hypothetical protein